MNAKVSEAWAGLRAIYEGAAPTAVLLAKAGRLTEGAVSRRAEREGWAAPDEMALRERQRRLQQQITRLDAQVDRLMAEAEEADVGLDKGRVDLLSTLLRSIDKLRETMPAARQEEIVKERDARIALILRKVHERIKKLAEEIASGRAAEQGRG